MYEVHLPKISMHQTMPVEISYEEQARLHLEKVCRDQAEALNDRNLTLDSPVWGDYLAPVFKAGPIPPLVEKKIDAEEYLRYLRGLCEAYPEWKLRVIDQNTHWSHDRRSASVYTNVENAGVPVGVVYQSVGISDFKFFEGKWMQVGYRGFAGGHGQGELF